ncbi:kinetoplastid-specific protein tyrosine phosphatase, putative [Trypanosoma equiperdum]|uniref:Kinetoplastid-specific protein tyrosine phosphatase, putative n=1 Tax=Trypanosoma equiperdum TaxID=5694 RepID=A0A1G4I3K6_TRYEQ|nr:kinetoplastid-specific protein tyrosine phosphatase, putative [Trypanosoma equiperdum]
MSRDPPGEGGESSPVCADMSIDKFSILTPEKQTFRKKDQSKVDGFLDRMRQRIHCTFCGGAKCKHENWESLKEKRYKTAIEGLISSWVGDDVIASQRPSTSLFRKYSLIEQFREKRITGVLNLQEKGEHASCGPDGIYASTGYSYSGEQDLMRHQISYYEFPWPDMTAPKQDIVLRSVQVMDSHVKKSGKVLVHCHAGLGRTGLMIACYLLYAQKMPSADVIELVRQMRPGAIQTSRQVKFIHDFESHLWRLSHTFRVEVSESALDIDLFLKKQRLLLHGDHADSYRFIPMTIHLILCQLLNLTKANPSNSELSVKSLGSGRLPEGSALNDVRRSINRRTFDATSVNDVKLLSYLVWDWFKSLSFPVLTPDEASAIVAYMRQPPGERIALPTFIRTTLRLSVVQTLGMVLSAYHIICLNIKESLKVRALRCLTDSFTTVRDGVTVRGEPGTFGLLYEFFVDWARLDQGGCFDLGGAGYQDHTISGIAEESADVL